MTRQSRKRAAKYSELSRTRKKRHSGRRLPDQHVAPVQVSEEAAVASSKTSAAPAVQPRIQSKMTPAQSRILASYQYVRDDLKKIVMLAVAMVVLLIILTFVLG